MTQREKVLELLRTRRPVTIAGLFDAGVGYTGRNDISDFRREGMVIGSKRGARPSDNAYILVSDLGETPDRGEVERLAADGWRDMVPDGELFRAPGPRRAAKEGARIASKEV